MNRFVRLLIPGLLGTVPLCAQIVIGPATLPTGQVNTPYSQKLTASGGTGPYTFTLQSGSFPSGLPAFSLTSGGLISGNPDGCASFVASPFNPCSNATEPINSTFTVLATDARGAKGTQTYTIGVYWNPSEASFETSLAGYNTNMLASVSGPKPILLGAHLGPANPLFRQPQTDNQANWNAWVDGIHAAAGTIVNIEPDMDCIFNNVTSCLALYSGAIGHAHSLGMSVSVDPAYYSWQACGGAGCMPEGPATGVGGDCQALIGHAVNSTPGNGVSDWYACVTTRIPALGMSAFQWMITHWLANGDRFVPVHEPTSMTLRWGEGINPNGCSSAIQPSQSIAECSGRTGSSVAASGNTCANDWWVNFVQPLLDPKVGLIPAWTTAAGLSIRIGVTTYLSEDQSYNPSFGSVFASNLPASVDMGFDMYFFKPANLSVYTAAFAQAQQYQHQIFAEEFAPETWTEDGAPASEQCAIKGCYSCDWQTSQTYQNFMATYLPYAASQGLISTSLFPAQILAGCAPSYPDNCNSQSVIASASTSFLAGSRSALSQKLSTLMTPGYGEPATITKTAGDGQSTPLNQAFPTTLAVTVVDTTGTPVAGATVTFTVTPGVTGASGVFNSTGPVVVSTNQSGSASAVLLTANAIPGQFTVTATVNALTATFSLANLGYILGTSSATVGSAAANGTLLLSGYGSWTATSNATWLHLAAGSTSGGASTLIQFSYDANTNPAKRTGTLTLAGLTFTVTQAGAGYSPVYPLATLPISGLSQPQAVAVDTQGNVYIADTANNEIKQWSPSTQQTVVIVSGLNAPAGVALDAHGDVCFSDSGNNAIKYWNPVTAAVSVLVPNGLSNPQGVAIDAGGNVYIADSGSHTVKQWNAVSQQVTVIVGSGLSTPVAVAVDAKGDLYIADLANNAVLEWSGGQLTTLVSGLSDPAGVTVDGQGNVYVTDSGNNALKQWRAATQQVIAMVTSGLNGPAGLAIDGSGNIYVADTTDSAIKEVTPAYLALSADGFTEGPQAGADSVTTQLLPPSAPLSATSDQGWLTIGAVAGGVVNFSFTANSATAARTANIGILGQQVVVTQNGLTAQTISLGSLPDLPYGSAPFALTATASSGLAVSLASTTPAVCTVSGLTVTIAAGGSCTIQATQAGNATYAAAAPVTETFNVTAAAQTISFASLPNLPYGSAPFAVTATASSGLPVTFSSTTPAACTVSGSSVTLAAAGSCTIQATQAGNGNYAAATPVIQTFQVTPAAQTISFASLPNLSYGSAPFAVAATATSGLAVAFASTTPACSVAANTVTIVAAGTCTIQATQAGNGNYAAATAVIQFFVVTLAAQTITFAPPASQTYGAAPLAVTATSTSGLPVAFSTSSPACTVAGSMVTIVAAGTCAIQATQVGNANYAAATPVIQTVQVMTAVQTITFAPLQGLPLGSAPFAVAATATSGLPVAFTATTLACTVDGTTVTIASVGTCTIQATQTGNANYAAASAVVQSFLITQEGQTITFGPLSDQVSTAAPFAISATASSGLPVTFGSNTPSVCSVSGNTVTLAGTGPCSIQATQVGNMSFLPATPVIQTFQVGQEFFAASSITIPSGAGPYAVQIAFVPWSAQAPWSATVNAGWLHLATTSGTGAALVPFTADANSDPSARAASITLDSGVTLAVTQAGTSYIGPGPLVPLWTSGLNAPTGTAVDSAGNVYIADAANNAVKQWSATTQQAATLVSGLSAPSGVAVDAAGNLYIADSGNNAIKQWSPSTQQVTALVSAGLNQPMAVAVDTSGNLYIADSGNQAIEQWNAATQQMTALISTGLQNPTGVAVDAAGNVYIADSGNNTIRQWSPATQQVTTLVSAGLNQPSAVAVDGSGNLYIADTKDNAIQQWNAAAQQLVPLVTTGLSQPGSVAVDAAGNVYIGDTGNNAVEEMPAAWAGPATLSEPVTAGSDALLPVLPASAPLLGIFAPASDQTWLTIGTVTNGVVSFSFTANPTTAARTANISILGQQIAVTQAGLTPQTITFGTLGDQPYGSAPFAVTATATSGLAVAFAATTPACTVAGATVTIIAAGPCTIQATQAGNANYAAATPVIQTFQVTPATQTITFASLQNQPYGSAPFAVAATATSGLAVAFASTTPACSVAANTVTIVAAGTCTIQATQAGNGNYAAATAVIQSFVVTLAAQTITFAPPASQTYGAAPFAVTATSTSGLPVAFATTSPACTVAGGMVTIVAAGTCAIQATQVGNANYAAATPVIQTVQVMTAVQTITFAPLQGLPLGSAPFAVAATATSGLPVAFTATTLACTVDGTTVTIASVGTCTIQATQTGNANYAAASAVVQSFLITQEGQTITFGPLSDQVSTAAPFAISATASSGLPVSFGSNTPLVCSVSGNTVTLAGTGPCSIQATQVGNMSFLPATPVIQTFLVGQEFFAASSITIPSGAGPYAVQIAFVPWSAQAPWSATVNAGWLHLATTSGTGAALVPFTADANSDPSARAASITLDSGVTLAVTQAGTSYIGPGPLVPLWTSGLNAPTGTAVDSAGNVYIADAANNAVKQWSATTQQAATLVSGLSAPSGVAVDAAGNVYIADSGNNAIKQWSPSTQQVTALVSAGLNQPIAVAVDTSGNLYIADSGNQAIEQWNAATQQMTALVSTGLQNPTGVAVDAAGNVYIADSGNHTIKQWSPATQQVTTLVSAGLNQPSAVAVDGSGNLYIADTKDNAIQQWNAAAQQLVPLVTAGLSQPGSVAVDAAGNVYIGDTGNNAVEEMPAAWAGPATLSEPVTAGSDALLPVLPASAPLVGIFAPASDQTWLTIGTVTNGVVSFSFTANPTTAARTANISILGQQIAVTQAGLTPQTITFGTLGDQPYGSAPFAVTATATSGLAVAFAATTPACTVAGATVTILAAGPCTIQATQAGNANYAAATPVIQTFQVTPATQTITFASLPNLSYGSAPFAVAATATSGLAIAFASTTQACSVAGNTVTIVAAGTCTIQATQAGNGNYAAASPVIQSFVVTQAAQTITFASLSNQPYGTASFAVTATSTSGLPVTLAATTPACTVAGATVTIVAAGPCTLQATQAGNANYAAATPVIQTFQVTQAAQTITFASLPNHPYGSAPFAVTATSTSGLPVTLAATTPACTIAGATVTLAAVGTCTIQATQPGNANYTAATTVIQSFQVTQGAQTITFGTLSNQHFGSAPFTVSASASSGLPVTFTSTQAVCTISGTTVTLVAVGTCTIQAKQAGNANWSAATPVNQSFQVTLGTQTITFGALSNQPYGSAPFAVSASASSGLPVTFTSTTAAVCTVSSSTVTLVAVGTCTIKASQAGNADWSAATSVNQSFQVTQASQTITFASLSNLAFGSAPFTVSATASSGLAVSFSSTTTAICTVSGTMVSLVAAGTCTVKAAQSGNANYAAATPVSQSFQVTPESQTITFAALSNRAYGSAPFSVSATASSGLAVSFASTTTTVCTVSSGKVTLVAAGTCTIQASQSGNANYAAATPVSQSFQVTPESQTITFATLSNRVYGSAPFNVSATASSGLAVSFASTTTTVCTVSGAKVTLVAGGTCTIQATQAGNANYAAATPVNQSFQVTPASQTITFSALSNRAFGSAPFTVSATASSGLAVSFASTTTGVCTVSTATVTLVAAGTCTIQATQAGNANYAAATPVSQTFQVTPGTQTITFAALPNEHFGTAPFGVSATASSGLPVSFASTTTAVCTVSTATVTLVAAGACTIQATQPGNANYAAATPVSQTFQVTLGAQTITFAALPNEHFGTAPFTVSATASSGLPVSFGSSTPSVCTVSGSTVTLVAVGACTIKASQSGDANWAAATPVSQSFQVTLGSQTITFSPLANLTLGTAPFNVGATASSGLAVSFASATPGVCTVSGSTVTLVIKGTCTIKASQPGNGDWAAATPVNQSFTVK